MLLYKSHDIVFYIPVKPSTPIITGTNTVQEDGFGTFQCTTSWCRPEAQLSWNFDGSKYTDENVPIYNNISHTYNIISNFKTRNLKREDNNKALKCIVTHEALLSPRTKTENLNVQCE